MRRGGSRLLALGCLAALAACRTVGGGEGVAREVDLSSFFAGGEPVEATFVLMAPDGSVTRHDPARAAERLLPASTFKIPHTLIALETGVAPDAGFTLPYDSARVRRDGFWADAWSRDHTLASAFQNSVYWFYQETARRIGERRMAAYLERFDYGNRDTSGGLDRFWLEGGLRISPDEQVRFLRRLHEERLGVSRRSTAILKEIMLLEEGRGYRLGGKTGTADVTPTREMAWLVGTLERSGAAWHFALNLEGEEVWERWGPPAAPQALVVALLEELGVLPVPLSRR